MHERRAQHVPDRDPQTHQRGVLPRADAIRRETHLLGSLGHRCASGRPTPLQNPRFASTEAA